MTVSEYIWDFLQKKGLTTVFMVSGSSAMWLTDALYKNDSLKAVCTHHEQVAAMAADGYGRVNGCPGACLVTIGPGATNAITGVAQAYLDSSPVFVISGQANSRLLQYEIDTGIRQHGTQSLNLAPIVSSITKYFDVVMKPEEIVQIMNMAWNEAVSGRKGPVWIDVPVDVQNQQIPDDHLLSMECKIISDKAKIDVQIILDKLYKAKQPVILAGFGVRSSGAVDYVIEFAQRHGIPIVTSRGGIDIISSDSDLYIGRPGAYGDRASHFAIQRSDFLFILGSRLSVSTIGYYPKDLAANAFKIMVDIDKKELAKEDVPVDIKINEDVNEFILALLDADKRVDVKYDEWLKTCRSWKEKYPTVLPHYKNDKPINSYYFTDLLSRYADDEANIVVDTGSVCNVVSQSWKIKKGQRYLISGGLSCMGFWATSIGASTNGKQTIAISGDGSMQMNIQELATLSYNQIPVKLFVYNNNGYMLIRHNQHNYMNDRFLGVGPDSGISTPDFYEVAKAYGIKAFKVNADDDIEEIMKKILNTDGPVLCEVMMQHFAPIEPRIASKVMPDGSLKAAAFDDLYPFLEYHE